MRSRRKVIVALVVFVLIVGLVFAGFQLFVVLRSDPGGEGPEHPVVVGVRADDDRLTIAIGRSCPQGSTVDVSFNPYGEDRVALEFTSAEALSRFEPEELPPDTTVETALPAGFMWRSSTEMILSVHFARGGYGWTAHADLTAADPPAGYPPDVYFFGDFGWLTEAEVAARDGMDLMTACTPQ